MKSITQVLFLATVSLAGVNAFTGAYAPATAFSRPAQASAVGLRLPVDSKQRNSATRIFMGWGPDPIWTGAEVTANDPANMSEKCVSITVSIPPETAQEYKVPGQYVQFRLNEETKPLFLAIASAPDAENAKFEFLIKKTPDNGWITDSAAGTKVEVSQVLGGGFPMEEHLEGFKYDFPTQNVLLFAAGSGIAPLKAAMESGKYSILNSTSQNIYRSTLVDFRADASFSFRNRSIECCCRWWWPYCSHLLRCSIGL